MAKTKPRKRGQEGGRAILRERGSDYFAELGRRGAAARKRCHDSQRERPATAELHVGLPADCTAYLRQVSRQTGRSVSAITREALAYWIEAYEVGQREGRPYSPGTLWKQVYSSQKARRGEPSGLRPPIQQNNVDADRPAVVDNGQNVTPRQSGQVVQPRMPLPDGAVQRRYPHRSPAVASHLWHTRYRDRNRGA